MRPSARPLRAWPVVLLASAVVLADDVPQTLPFAQDWSNTDLVATDDVWSGVPGLVGHRGDGLTSATNADPQTILAEGTGTPVDVNANETNPSGFSTGGVAEFHLADPVVAIQGSGTADAPFLLVNLDTTGASGVTVTYRLRDLDGSGDHALQQVALHYRVVGASPTFTNLPQAYVADATTGPSLAVLETPVCAVLPSDADDKPHVQVRVMTTNAAGNDEWVGVDDIQVGTGGTCPPSAAGDAEPSVVLPGGTTLLTVQVTPGSSPAGMSHTVTADLTSMSGPAALPLLDDGMNGDVAAGDLVFSAEVTVDGAAVPGPKALPVTVLDDQSRTATTSIGLDVQSPPLSIAHVQGSGTRSPFEGVIVSTTGLVTGVKLNGFFLQAPEPGDGDPATSDGLFVFTSTTPAVTVGDELSVTGRVQEFVPSQDPASAPLTELASPSWVLVSAGNPLPVPVEITAGDTDPAGTPEQLEPLEGMRVSVPSMTAVSPTQGNVAESIATSTSNGVFYGVVTGVGRPFREPGVPAQDPLPPDAPCCVPRFDENPERLRVDSDGLAGATPLEVTTGATVSGLVGPLDFGFRTYTILPDPAAPPVVSALGSGVPVRAPAADEFTVGSFNLERFFDDVNDPAISEPVLTSTAFGNRLAKASLAVRTMMASPDVLGVQEVEGLQALEALAARINADALADTGSDPAYDAYLVEGNDVGGIDSGFLVKSTRVAVLDVTQEGKDATYVNPSTGLPELLNDRPPLVLRAVVQGPVGGSLPVTVVVNHLRSLSGVADAADGARVRAKRAAQAEYLAALIQARQAADPLERIVSVGDYNAFPFNDGYVDVVGTVRGAPADPTQVLVASPDLVDPDLVNLLDLPPAEQRYSFSFDGNAQVLDHILVNARAFALVNGLELARSNADFPESFRNDPGRPERISDHDMPVAYLRLPPPALSVSDATVPEGDRGATPADFVVSLSGPSAQPVSVTFSTANGTARAGSDYGPKTARLVFPPGATSRTVTVFVRGDRTREPHEFFRVRLAGVEGATLGRSMGRGIIVDDDR